MRTLIFIVCLCLAPGLALAEDGQSSNAWLKSAPSPAKTEKKPSAFEMSFGQTVPGSQVKPGVSANWHTSKTTVLSAGVGCPLPGANQAAMAPAGPSTVAPAGSLGLSVSF